MDKTGDDMLWNDCEDDGNVKSECGEDQGTDCRSEDSDTVDRIWHVCLFSVWN
jgi:hypothetical protein